MIFVFSKHLGKKANKLQVSRSDLATIITKGQKWLDSRGDKNWHVKYSGFEVVYKKHDNTIFIITIKYPKW